MARDIESIISVTHPTDRPNFTVISVGELITVWISYRTPVAFSTRAQGWEVRVTENVWGPTTGKHLNHIDGGEPAAKKARLPWSEFEKLYRAALEECGILIPTPVTNRLRESLGVSSQLNAGL